MDQNNGLERLSNLFLLTTVLIVFFGVVMVFSSSYMWAREQHGGATYFLVKQLIFILAGTVGAIFLSRTKISFWYKQAYKVHALCIGLLVLTMVPGIGLTMKGSQRWINIGFMNLQPGEFVKISLVLAAIRFFENFNAYDVRQRSLYGATIALPLVCFLIQPDFGTFAIASMIVTFIAYLSHFPRKYFWSGAAFGFVSAVGLLFAAPYRVKRIMVFLDPWQDPRNAGFQIIQSFLAFANGSVFGQGLGNSNEKLFYLPEAYNDFIFSVVGEELGFVGVCVVISLFLAFIYFGFRLSLGIKSRLGALLVATVTFTIGFQAFLNMGVVLGVLPTKGLNLPFISYGGSSMVANLAALGLMFAAIRANGPEAAMPRVRAAQRGSKEAALA